jgi:hypothetical protein
MDAESRMKGLEKRVLVPTASRFVSSRATLKSNQSTAACLVIRLPPRDLLTPLSQPYGRICSPLKVYETPLSIDILRSRLPCRDAGNTAWPPPPGNGPPPPPGPLPIYVVVVGVEGAGHHALETVWHGLEKYYNLYFMGYNAGVHAMAKPADVSRAYQFASPDFARYRASIASFLNKPWVRDKPLIFDSRNSYPMGFGVGALAHPDLVYLAQLDGDLIDLRVVVLYRDPVACVLSAVRRFKVAEFQYKNYQFQARAVQESLSLINNAIPFLPCGKFAIFPYEELVQHPHQHAQSLAQLIGVRKGHLESSFNELKPPNKKPVEDLHDEAHTHLQEFFKRQNRLWPLLAGDRPIPAVNIRRGLAPERGADDAPNAGEKREEGAQEQNDATPAESHAANHQGKPAPDSLEDGGSADGRFLQINWFLHLGFNNVRFIMEMGFGMAHQLQRRLLLPSHLRMRRCLDETLCQQSPCEVRTRGQDVSYWCPLTIFLEEDGLVQRGGGLIVEDFSAFARTLRAATGVESVEHVSHAFKDVYDETQLWVDRLPSPLQGNHFDNEHRYVGPGPASVDIFRYHLGCELSYFKVVKKAWDVKPQSQVRVFREAFHSSHALLHLDGTPHKIGVTPFVWSSNDAAAAAQDDWENAVVYTKAVMAYAEAIVGELLRRAKATTYTCVHLRRGDFVSAGWLGKAKDLSLVQANIEAAMEPGEALYLATDETSEETLAGLRGIGAKRWSDFGDTVRAEGKKIGGAAAFYVGFEDYVGLVEQIICGKARIFLGSQCSSFTGGILNLRRKLVGDTTYHTVVSNKKVAAKETKG